MFAWTFARFIGVLSLVDPVLIKAGINQPALELLCVAVGCFLANVIQNWFVETTGHALISNVRIAVFSHLVYLPAAFFDQKDLPMGYILNLLSVDAVLVKGWAVNNVALVVQQFCSVVAALVIASMADFRLAAVSLAGFVAMVPAIWLQTRFLSDGATKCTFEDSAGLEAEGPSTTSVDLLVESIDCVRTVDAFNLHERMLNEYEVRVSAEKKVGHQTAILSGFFYGLSQFCQFGSQALALWYGGRAYAFGDIQDLSQMIQVWK